MKVLQFTDVSLVREQKEILSKINWQVKPKENWAILGLNGSGKTSLLQLICGYLWPTSGHLEVLGEVFGKTSIPELRKKIGWVSTALQYQLKDYERSEKIVLSGKFASIGIYQQTTEAELEEAKQLLIDCGGQHLIGKKYQVLSQGERQIVLIARALMSKPELLILDEPCNGLDIFAKESLLKRIEKIAQSKNSPSILFVSHHTEEILPCFDQLILLRDGKIFKQGLTADLLTRETLNQFYPHPVSLIVNENGRKTVIPANSNNL